MNKNLSWPEGIFSSGPEEYKGKRHRGNYWLYNNSIIVPSELIKYPGKKAGFDVKDCWEKCKQNTLAKETDKAFEELLRKEVIIDNNIHDLITGRSKLKAKLHILDRNRNYTDQELSQILYYLKSINGLTEFPAPIIDHFWWVRNVVPLGGFTPELLRKSRAAGIEDYVSDFQRGLLFFDYYIPELHLRIEHDGSQHRFKSEEMGEWGNLSRARKKDLLDRIKQDTIDKKGDWYFKNRYGIETLRLTSFSCKEGTEKERKEELNKLILEIARRVTGETAILPGCVTLEKDTRLIIFFQELTKEYVIPQVEDFYYSSSPISIRIPEKLSKYSSSLVSFFKLFYNRKITILENP